MQQDPNLTVESRSEYVQTVRRNARHLLDLINDILDLSKIEAGQMTVETADCDVPNLMAEIMSTMRPRAVERGIKFSVHFDGPIPRIIRTDTLRVRQILMNLLGNAIKFTERGTVKATTRFVPVDGANALQIEVMDSGIGLTVEQIGRLFKPFTQADESTTRKFGGTGLGLTISRQLARLLGGDITVKSAPGIGSVFTVTVDCGITTGLEMISDLAESTLLPKVEPVEFNTLKVKGRLLLADDGKDNQRLLGILLRSAGAEVVIAENGLIAIQKLAAQPFDLVLMDMQMPEMDGYAATTELRRIGCRLPIVALTANALAEDRAKCLAAGCTDYLSKPVNPEKLIRTVARHLGQEVAEPAPALQPAAPPAPTPATGTIHSTLRDFPGFDALIDQFISELPDEIAKLQALVKAGDAAPVRRLVHQIKGVGGGYGFDPITEAAQNAETQLDAGNHGSMAETVDRLIGVMRRVEKFDDSKGR